MVKIDIPIAGSRDKDISIVRHKDVKQKLKISSAKLFDMVAKGLFPKPFPIVPGGRAVGWLESTVDGWILEQQQQASLGNKARDLRHEKAVS
jgi:prophage regulatory protein